MIIKVIKYLSGINRISMYIKLSFYADVHFIYRYVHFDFHHICRGGNFDNLQVLYNQIEEAIQKQG